MKRPRSLPSGTIARKALAERIEAEWVAVCRPNTVAHPTVSLGPGTVVFAGAEVEPDTWSGAHSITTAATGVDHHRMLADFVHVAPGGILCGGAMLRDGALMGVGSKACPSGSDRAYPGSRQRLLISGFDSNWIAPLGPEGDAFERDVANRVGLRAAAALSSGTAALHLALVLLDVDPGDEVWTATLTFAATANAIRYVGATPVFIDSECESRNKDPALLREALHDASTRGALPKALTVVDLYGQCADDDAILDACQEYGVPIVEDTTEALGATYGERPAGSFGAISVLSFKGNKIVTTSGGGAMLSDDPALVERARRLASRARQPVMHYEHEEVGYNYRLGNQLEAVGQAQLTRFDGLVKRRRAMNRTYRVVFGGTDGIASLPEAPGALSTCWLIRVLLDEERLGFRPEQIREHRENHNIEARPV